MSQKTQSVNNAGVGSCVKCIFVCVCVCVCVCICECVFSFLSELLTSLSLQVPDWKLWEQTHQAVRRRCRYRKSRGGHNVYSSRSLRVWVCACGKENIRKCVNIWDWMNANKLFFSPACASSWLSVSQAVEGTVGRGGLDREECVPSLSPFPRPLAATVLNPLPRHCDEGWWLWNYCEAPRCLSVQLSDYWDW